jgi:hypothetical protein
MPNVFANKVRRETTMMVWPQTGCLQNWHQDVHQKWGGGGPHADPQQNGSARKREKTRRAGKKLKR